MDKFDKIASPFEFYKHPKDVEQDNSLTDVEKIVLLQNWLDDIELRQTAEAENMQSNKSTKYHLAEIKELLNKYLTTI